MAPYPSWPILRHILVRREAAGLEDGRSGEAVDIRVGQSYVIFRSVEELWDWKTIGLL